MKSEGKREDVGASLAKPVAEGRHGFASASAPAQSHETQTRATAVRQRASQATGFASEAPISAAARLRVHCVSAVNPSFCKRETLRDAPGKDGKKLGRGRTECKSGERLLPGGKLNTDVPVGPLIKPAWKEFLVTTFSNSLQAEFVEVRAMVP
jgi:hypothetical protein